MADESSRAKAPGPGPGPAAPPPAQPLPPSSSSPADSYIGSFISLTSKFEIRYEGVLYHLNPQDSTLGLKNVKSFGTEGRKKDGPQIPPSDKVYEYILFRGDDIKDLQVKASRPPQVEETIYNDPAIIQSQSATGGRGSTLAQQSGVNNIEQEPPQMYPSANVPSYSTQNYWQGYSGATSTNVYAQKNSPSVAASFSSLPNISEPLPMTGPLMIPLTTSSVSLASIPFSATSVYPNAVSSQTPQFLAMPPVTVHSTMSALSNQPNVVIANMSSYPQSAENVNKIAESNTGKVFSDPVPLHNSQPLSHSAYSVVDSSQGSILRQAPVLLTPDQFPSRLPEMPPQSIYPNQKDMVGPNFATQQILYPNHQNMVALGPNVTSSGPLALVTDPVNRAPLLPLEPPGQQYTEEFDFEAMNEKFRKDDIWGYLGKGKQKDAAGTAQDDAIIRQTSREVDGGGLPVEVDSKPAYKKDDFFDSISCNTTIHRDRNGQHRFSDRMKHDTQTFGQFQQRPHPVYGGYGPGPGMNRMQYGWGRGYNPPNRGRGGHTWY